MKSDTKKPRLFTVSETICKKCGQYVSLEDGNLDWEKHRLMKEPGFCNFSKSIPNEPKWWCYDSVVVAKILPIQEGDPILHYCLLTLEHTINSPET